MAQEVIPHVIDARPQRQRRRRAGLQPVDPARHDVGAGQRGRAAGADRRAEDDRAAHGRRRDGDVRDLARLGRGDRAGRPAIPRPVHGVLRAVRAARGALDALGCVHRQEHHRRAARPVRRGRGGAGPFVHVRAGRGGPVPLLHGTPAALVAPVGAGPFRRARRAGAAGGRGEVPASGAARGNHRGHPRRRRGGGAVPGRGRRGDGPVPGDAVTPAGTRRVPDRFAVGVPGGARGPDAAGRWLAGGALRLRHRRPGDVLAGAGRPGGVPCGRCGGRLPRGAGCRRVAGRPPVGGGGEAGPGAGVPTRRGGRAACGGGGGGGGAGHPAPRVRRVRRPRPRTSSA